MDKTISLFEKDNSKGIRELNIIIKISQNLINTLDHEKVLQIISDGMSELLEIESAAIYISENEEEIFLGAATPPLDPNMPDSLRKANLTDHPHIKKAILTRKPLFLPDTRKAQLSPTEEIVVQMRQLRSLLYFPFIQEDKVLGILILGTCNKSKTYSEHEIDFGQTVANQLSVAIQNSKLHKDLKNYKENLENIVAERTNKLKEANEELQTLNDELYEKNAIVLKQKEEIETALNHLKSIQVKLIQSEKMASLGVLTAGVAHEINNPLNFIMGAYHGLENFFSNSPPEHKQQVSILLNGLRTGLDRVSGIVQGLNQFSRDNKTYNEDCNIHSILENCLEMLKYQYNDNISIVKSYDPEPLIIVGNVGKLHQVFINILSNAIQAIKNKGQISISTRKSIDIASISIRDTGCGIKKENLLKITDPFFTTKDPQMGTGLGLSIAYNIVQEHKGQLEFESELEIGTTVNITLPINNKK